MCILSFKSYPQVHYQHHQHSWKASLAGILLMHTPVTRDKSYSQARVHEFYNLNKSVFYKLSERFCFSKDVLHPWALAMAIIKWFLILHSQCNAVFITCKEDVCVHYPFIEHDCYLLHFLQLKLTYYHYRISLIAYIPIIINDLVHCYSRYKVLPFLTPCAVMPDVDFKCFPSHCYNRMNILCIGLNVGKQHINGFTWSLLLFNFTTKRKESLT